MPLRRTRKGKSKRKRKSTSVDEQIEEQYHQDLETIRMVDLAHDQEAAEASYGEDGTTEEDL